MQPKRLDPAKYRFERKFMLHDLSLEEVEMIVRLHPAFFSEIYHERTINNVYFDTRNLEHYYNNVDGRSERIKVRVRWYGDLFGRIGKPVLELKIKNGLLGRKESYVLPPFDFREGYSAGLLKRMFDNVDLPAEVNEELQRVNPVIINRYRRKYFISPDKKFRITLDHSLEFFKVKSFSEEGMQRIPGDTSVIVELKYGYEDEKEADRISTRFPFRVTKSSKYVDGMDKLANAFLIS